MQNIRYLTVNKSDLAWLFHTSEATVEKWKKSGLQQITEGKFLLSEALSWLKEQHKKEIKNKLMTGTVNQQDLADLLGVSRQTITAWGRAEIPRNANKTYDLKNICRFLRDYYRQCAEREYQRKHAALKKKLRRNINQVERFLAGENSITG